VRRKTVSHLSSRVRWLLLLALAVAVASPACVRRKSRAPAPPGVGDLYVLPPDEVHYGATYAEWSALWWQWVFEWPLTNHPLYDRTGADAHRGQIPPVMFLCGVLSQNGAPVDGTVVRNVAIREGTALFFPIVNSSWNNMECAPAPDTTWSFTELREFAANQVVNARNLRCSLNGLTLLDSPDFAGAERFRAQAPEFGAWFTADNVFSDWCGAPQPARVVEPVASDGVWMMIAPLPVGGHTLNFSGTIPTAGPDLVLDVTYHITVMP
jgi:hypothetical protein